MSLFSRLFGKKHQPSTPQQPTPRVQGGDEETTRFIETFTNHLARVKAHMPQLAAFLDTYFDDASVAQIAAKVVEKMMLTRADGRQHSIVLDNGPVVYHITTVAVEMTHAAEWFARSSGGYTKLLSAAQHAVLSQSPDFAVWCHIIYGWEQTRYWVHMAICPLGDDSPIDDTLMPIELLTPAERREFGL